MTGLVDIDSAEYRLGENIRRGRERLGLSQTQLANRIGIDRAAISKYENGTRGEMGFKTLHRFSMELHISVDELLGAPQQDCHVSTLSMLEQLSEENLNIVRSIIEGLILKQQEKEK